MKSHLSLVLILIFASAIQRLGAQDWKNLNSDDLFLKAREEAFNGDREEARIMLRFILEKSPTYADVRILLARTFAWDGDRNSSRLELQKVLTDNPKNQDGLNALIDTEMWDDSFENGLTVANGALAYYPNFEDFVYKKASILNSLGRQEEALAALSQLLSINPAHEKGMILLQAIKTEAKIYRVGASFGIDVFSRTFDPTHYAFIQASRLNNWGSAILRLNYSNRFGTNGLQPEIDLYPRIVNGVYAYLNYGYSTSSIFPNHRIGAEIYSKLPRSMEASAGVRYLNFDSQTKVTIFTGSISKYFKSYWLSFRPYITPDKNVGTSYSANLLFRKYFQDGENYIGWDGGIGFSPDERRFQSGAGFTGDNIYVLKSQKAGFMLQRTLKHYLILNANIDFTRQELIFDQGNYVIISSFLVGIRRVF